MEIETEDFIKGLRLLHSRSQESSDELKKLLDHYQAKKLNHKLESRKPIMNAFSAIQSLNQCINRVDDTSSGSGNKKMKTIEDDSETTDIEDNELLDSNESLTSTSIVSNQCCCICKQNIDTIKLLECNECHQYYHNDCHKPPFIMKKELLNDPRSIWYCFKCNNNKNPNNGRLKLSNNKLTTSGKVIIDPNKVVHHKQSMMMDTLKQQRSNKIATTQSTPFHPILKSSSIGTTASTSATTASTISTGLQPQSNRQTMALNNLTTTTTTNAKTKANATIQTATATTNATTIPMDKRLANMKKAKSNNLKFS